MWQKFKTYGLVSLITVLIWTWAERESLTASTVDARIDVATGEKADLTTRVVEPQWKGSVRVNLRGSNASIDAASRVLSSTLRLTPGIGGVPGTSGEHVVDLREALRDHPDLRRLGVTIAGVEPPSCRIVVEELVKRTVPLRLQAPGAALEGEPTFLVTSVEVQLPAAAAGRITEGTFAPAVVSTEVLSRLSDETAQVVQARISPPESLVGVTPVTMNPETVQVTLKLRARRETIILSEVPVYVALPPGAGGRWTVEAETPVIRNVVASGPREAIDVLRQNPGVARAVVTLTSEDLAKGIESAAAAVVGGPAGVRFEGGELRVRLRITPTRS